MTGFSAGLHVTGQADPGRVVCATHNPGVQIRIAPSLRQQWAAINAYKTIQEQTA